MWIWPSASEKSYWKKTNSILENKSMISHCFYSVFNCWCHRSSLLLYGLSCCLVVPMALRLLKQWTLNEPKEWVMKLEEIPRRSHSLSLSVLVSIHQFFRAQLSADLNKLLHQGNHSVSETDRGCMLLCKKRKKEYFKSVSQLPRSWRN